MSFFSRSVTDSASKAGLVPALVALCQEPVVILTDGLHRFVSPAYVRLVGFEAEAQLVGTAMVDVIAATARAPFLEWLRLGTECGFSTQHRTRGLRRDGSEFIADVRAAAVEHSGEDCLVLLCVRERPDQLRLDPSVLHDERRLFPSSSNDGEATPKAGS